MAYSGQLEQGEILTADATGMIAAPLGLGLTWDTTQASDAKVRRYATFAEIVTALGSLESPASVFLRGTCLANVVGTYAFGRVTFWTTRTDTILRGSEGVVFTDAVFVGPMTIQTLATTTIFLTYSDLRSPTFRASRLEGNGTRGLIGSLASLDFQVFLDEGTIVGQTAFETTAAINYVFTALRAEWESGAGGHVLGTLGFLTVKRNFETLNNIELDVWGGGAPTYLQTESLNGVTISGVPAVGQIPTATSGTAATWQTPGGVSGNARAILWDADLATDAALGRYATMTEVLAITSVVQSPIRLKLKGAISFDVVGTHEWGHVTVEGNATGVSGTAAIGDEGVIIRNVRWEAPIAVSSSATTTRLFEYTAGRDAYFEGAVLTGNAAVGLIRANHSGVLNLYLNGVTIGRNTLEFTTTTTANVFMRHSVFGGASLGHVLGTLGTLNLSTDAETTGTYDSAAYSGTENFILLSNPTQINGVGISGTPSAGQVPTAVSGTAATWQTPSGGGGPPASITWDPALATDAASRRYQTWAEVRTIANSTTAPLAVRVVGVATTSGTTSDTWPHVTFMSEDPAAVLTFTEGVEIYGLLLAGPMSVTSTATTTNALQYDENVVGVFSGGVKLSGSATRGLMTSYGASSELRYDQAVIGEHTFESTAATPVNVYVPGSEWIDAEQFFGSSGATFEFKKNADTAGVPDLSALTATITETYSPYVGATRTTPDANDLICFNLNEVAGTTSITSTGAGTPVPLTIMSGTGDLIFGSQCPFGNGLLQAGLAYFEGVGAAKTYAPFVQDFTLQCWVKYMSDLDPGGGLALLVGKRNAGGASATYLLAVDTITGEINFEIGTGAGQVTGVSDFTLAKGEWSHVALTYDGANILLYINGLLAQTVAQTGNMDYDATQSMLLGNAAANGAGYILSTVWLSDIVRTQAAIQSIYNTGAFNGAIGVLDAQSINGVDVSPTAPVVDMILTALSPATAAFATPRIFRDNADIVASAPGSTTNVLDAEVGHIFGVFRDMYCDGIRIYWAALAGTPVVTVTLYDDTGAVMATEDVSVTTTPTYYDVMFATPVDLSTKRWVDLIVSAWENVAGVSTTNYYSTGVLTNFATQATPLPMGFACESRGSIYVSPGGSVPVTTTGIEFYPVSPILRLK